LPVRYRARDLAIAYGNCFRGLATAFGRIADKRWGRSGATEGGHSAEPRKARFFAEQKMRPNEFLPESHIFVNYLQVEAL
jgi:hypothetical protein